MAKVKMIVEDDFGNEISSTSYDLGSSLNTIAKIEGSISEVSGKLLGQVASDVLEVEQSLFSKKTDISVTDHTL